MLRRILFRLFWNTYDNLGHWLLVGVTGFLLSLPLVTAPAAWGGLLAMAARAERGGEITVSLYLRDLRTFARRSTLLGLLLAAGILLCAVNIFFYTHAEIALRMPGLARIVIASLFFWIALFGWIGLQIGWAFLVLQDLPLKKAFTRGFIVLGAHPFSALFCFFLALVLFVLLGLTGIGLILLFGPLAANLTMGIAAGAVEHYEELEDKRQRERLKQEGARSWKELKELDEREAARFRRYDRGWRDILRPWEMR